MEQAEAKYKDLQQVSRKFLIDMNVPTSLVEKMFSISSEDIYLLGPEGINLIAGQTPAFDEWKKSRCGTASPHYGEFVKWFKCDVDVWDEEKKSAIQKYTE